MRDSGLFGSAGFVDRSPPGMLLALDEACALLLLPPPPTVRPSTLSSPPPNLLLLLLEEAGAAESALAFGSISSGEVRAAGDTAICSNCARMASGESGECCARVDERSAATHARTLLEEEEADEIAKLPHANR